MANVSIDLAGERLEARPEGALFWPSERLLAVGDLHLGRAAAAARRGDGLMPPYADRDTLDRLMAEVAATQPRRVVLVGDSFDDAATADDAAAMLSPALQVLAAGRDVVWIAGNHDPRPVADLPGRWAATLRLGPLAFRHIATKGATTPGQGEVSAHFHPRATLVRRGGVVKRRCFLAGGGRVILPAFGTYTGGMDADDPIFDPLIGAEGRALLLGRHVVAVPRRRLGAGAPGRRRSATASL